MKNYKLTESKIGTATVIVDILPKGKCIPNTTITPTSITIHNTGNIDASAQNNHNYMRNINKSGERIASWHFTVGYDKVIQAIPTNKKAYHAGNSTGNNTSIGIEICMYKDKEKQRQAYMNAIALVKILMSYHKLDINKVKRHKDWSGKHCPAWLIEGKYGYTWTWFKNQIKTTTIIKEPAEKKESSNKEAGQETTTNFLVRITTDSLNIRKGPGTSYGIVGTVKKNEVYTIIKTNGAWGYLKSTLGWINISDKYVKKI